MSYKNRRYGLTSLEKMNIKSMCEKIETLCNISNLTGTNTLDKLIKGMCNIYMETIIADDSSPLSCVPIFTSSSVSNFMAALNLLAKSYQTCSCVRLFLSLE